MNSKRKVLLDIQPVSPDTWKAKIIKDLKGKSYDSIQWQVDPDIRVEPFYHPDQVCHVPMYAPRGGWKIGQFFPKGRPSHINTSILSALEMGIETPVIEMEEKITTKELDKILEGVMKDMINFVFAFKGSREEIQHNLDVVQSSFKSESQVFLSLPSGEFTSTHLAHNALRLVAPCAPDISIKSELKTLLETGARILKNNGSPASFFFEVTLGDHFFVEISRLQALRILWANLLQTQNIDHDNLPPIHAVISLADWSGDPNESFIAATTRCLSAVLGGADLIYVLPPQNLPKDKLNFYNRMTRNIHHLLRMESFMEDAVDVMEGNYLVSEITAQICEHTWKEYS